LPRSRAFRFAPDLSAFHIGHSLKTVTPCADRTKCSVDSRRLGPYPAPRPSSRTFQKRPELWSASVLGHNHQDGDSSPQDELRQRRNYNTQLQNRNLCLKSLRANPVVPSNPTSAAHGFRICRISAKSPEWCAEHAVEVVAPDKPTSTLEESSLPRKFAPRCTAPARNLTASFYAPQAKSNDLAPAHPLPVPRAGLT